LTPGRIVCAIIVGGVLTGATLFALGFLPAAGSHSADARGRGGAVATPVPRVELGVGRVPGGQDNDPADPVDPATVATNTPVPGTPVGSGTPSTAPTPTASPVLPTLPVPLKSGPALVRSGVWQFAESAGVVLGTGGPLRRFRVAVEQGLPVEVAEFSDLVDSTLGDSRSWIAGGEVRLQQVSGTGPYDFTIYLASPDSAYELCLASGVDIRIGGVPYTSCRAGVKVVVNAARYLDGIPDYGAPLEAYRRYVVNHEVGHWLGHGHVACPAVGALAPVMAQQTLGLAGCVPNSWPYVDGQRYDGPPIAGL
jgi:hypothetical protein